MPKNVIAFPDRPFREWAVVEKALIDRLLTDGHSQSTVDHVCGILKPVFMEQVVTDNFSIDGGDIEESIQQINFSFSRVTTGLFLHLANLAIENHALIELLEQQGGSNQTPTV